MENYEGTNNNYQEPAYEGTETYDDKPKGLGGLIIGGVSLALTGAVAGGTYLYKKHKNKKNEEKSEKKVKTKYKWVRVPVEEDFDEEIDCELEENIPEEESKNE